MADSTPSRFGQGQDGSDTRHLFLKQFGGEVLTAYSLNTLTLDKHVVKAISAGKSWQFPKTWQASTEYHTPGSELLGDEIETSEIVVTMDGLLVSHVGIYDLDEKMSHFDVTSQFSSELGKALARTFDKNVFRALILAARTAADGPFPGGTVVTDANLNASGSISGADWIDAIRSANITLFGKDVPEDLPRYMSVNAAVFDAIKYARDANGHYLLLNRDTYDVPAAGGIAGRGEFIMVDGVKVYRSRNMPNTNESADSSVYSKYRANYSTTTGVLWCPQAVATVKLMDIALETERDVRRQEDFMVAKMAVGHGTLRPELAVEFKTS